MFVIFRPICPLTISVWFRPITRPRSPVRIAKSDLRCYGGNEHEAGPSVRKGDRNRNCVRIGIRRRTPQLPVGDFDRRHDRAASAAYAKGKGRWNDRSPRKVETGWSSIFVHLQHQVIIQPTLGYPCIGGRYAKRVLLIPCPA
jgi:hypothetical protein